MTNKYLQALEVIKENVPYELQCNGYIKTLQEAVEKAEFVDNVAKGKTIASVGQFGIVAMNKDKWFLMVELANSGVVIDVKDLGNLDAVKEMVKVLNER